MINDNIRSKAELDSRLDKALEDTFPASDPPSMTLRGKTSAAADPADAARKEEACEKLDEELEETFPASDPPAAIQPGSGITGPGN